MTSLLEILALHCLPPDIDVVLRRCPVVELEHKRSTRQYCHTLHRRGNVICCARATEELPLENKLGLLVHEIGHLALRGRPHSENDANKAGCAVTGIPVAFKGPLRLEWSRFPRWLLEYLEA
jgi:predicted GNAT family N-acyltransferase